MLVGNKIVHDIVQVDVHVDAALSHDRQSEHEAKNLAAPPLDTLGPGSLLVPQLTMAEVTLAFKQQSFCRKVCRLSAICCN